jgi:hypothetical protein
VASLPPLLLFMAPPSPAVAMLSVKVELKMSSVPVPTWSPLALLMAPPYAAWFPMKLEPVIVIVPPYV